MENATIRRTICKIAVAGERAGFTVEQMIELLNNGLDVPTLVSMIEWKLNYTAQPIPALPRDQCKRAAPNIRSALRACRWAC